MPLRNARGDLLKSNCQVLVNAVNCVGVAGAGLALQFKEAFPRQVAEYEAACRRGEVRPGVLHKSRLPGDRVILSVPTKRHWRNPALLTDVHLGIRKLRLYCERENPASMALPALGCGLGGLHESLVAPLIDDLLSDLPCEIHVYGLNPKRVKPCD